MMGGCHCGSMDLRRITIERGGRQVSTEFMTCAECRLMYWIPEPASLPPPAWVDAMPSGYWKAKLRDPVER